MKMNFFSKNFFVLFIIGLNLSIVLAADIRIYKKTDLEEVVYTARFYEISIAKRALKEGMMAPIIIGQPEDGCRSLRDVPDETEEDKDNDYFALINRSTKCELEDKVKHAKEAGFKGMIIYTEIDSDEFKKDLKYNVKIAENYLDFPILSVDIETALNLKSLYTYDKGYLAYYYLGEETSSTFTGFWFYAVIGGIVITVGLVGFFSTRFCFKN